MSHGTIFNVIREDLGLVKKSARWVRRLLTEQLKARRTALSASFKNNVDMKRKSSVSLHTPETKNQSKQKILNQERLRKATEGFVFHWDNVPIPTEKSVKSYLRSRTGRLLPLSYGETRPRWSQYRAQGLQDGVGTPCENLSQGGLR